MAQTFVSKKPDSPPLKESIFLQGKLEDFNLSDIIQLLIISQKTGLLVIQDLDSKEEAKLYIEDSSLIHAEMGEEKDEAVFEKVMRVVNGMFYFQLEARTMEKTMAEDLQTLLLNTVNKIDDIQKLSTELPDDGTKLFINDDVKAVPEITLDEWKVLALVNGRRTIRHIYQTVGNELITKRILVEMIKKGAVGISNNDDLLKNITPTNNPTDEAAGERPIPSRLRTNLVLKQINGKNTLQQIRTSLEIDARDLLEDIKLLYETNWIDLTKDERKLFYSLLNDV